jgi:hypothetical protein
MTDTVFFLMYVFLTAVQLYGAGLFMWWWRKCRWSATPMYIYITALFFAMSFRNTFDTLAFYDRVLDDDPATWIYGHWLWKFRLVAVTIVCLVIVIHMSYRVFVQSKRGVVSEQSERKEQVR